MKNRRNFLKTSAAGIMGMSLAAGHKSYGAAPVKTAPLVRQPEQADTYLIRDDTPITIVLSKTRDNLEGMSLCFEELLPSAAIPTHKHLHADEYFHFITGTGVVIIEDKETPFKPGTVAFIPRGMWHSIKNSGVSKAFFSFGFSPAGFEDYFKEAGTPQGQPFKPKSAQELAALAAKYGMVYKK